MRVATTLSLFALWAAVGSCAVAQNTQKLTLVHDDAVSTRELPWAISEVNKSCTVTCNGEEVDQSGLHLSSEAKSCVGTFKVFCTGNNTGNSTNGFGAFGVKCEGKITTFLSNKTVSICEGAFQSFSSRGFKRPDGKFVKVNGAYGCLGTSIGLRSTSESAKPSGIDWNNFDLNASSDSWMESDEGAYAEARCDGLNGRFDSVKVRGPCNKDHGKDHGKDGAEFPRPPHSEEGPQGRHLLDDHKEKHDKHKDHAGKPKHHDDDMDSKHKKHVGKDKLADAHDDDHKDKKSHKHHKFETSSFEDVQDKVEHAMKKSSFELLPHALPRGSDLSNGPDCKITCNGRQTWFGAFFPCFGELVVDCEPGQHKPDSIANSPLDAEFKHGGDAEGLSRGPPAFRGTCKGFWSGALFKTCSGFSSSHVEAGPVEVWDFCSGKKSVRMGGAPGKGFAAGSWCKGKSLLVLDKE